MKFKAMLFGVIVAILIGFTCGCLFAADEQVIKVTAKKYEFSPKDITLKKGVPVLLQFTSLDRLHGFNCPDLNIRTDIRPEQVSTIRFIPNKVGTFPFHCDRFCGIKHGSMKGIIKVVG